MEPARLAIGPRRAGLDRDAGAGERPRAAVRDGQRVCARYPAVPGRRSGGSGPPSATYRLRSWRGSIGLGCSRRRHLRPCLCWRQGSAAGKRFGRRGPSSRGWNGTVVADAKKYAQAERSPHSNAEKTAKKQTERALIAEQAVRRNRPGEHGSPTQGSDGLPQAQSRGESPRIRHRFCDRDRRRQGYLGNESARRGV